MVGRGVGRLAGVAVVAAALLLAACDESASPSASPSPSEGLIPSSLGPLPSLTGDPELEATLPSEAAGITLQSFSMSGPDFVTGGEVDPQFVDFLDRLGADPEDVSVAFAFGANTDGSQTASIFAFQVAGAEAQDLIDEFQASAEEGGDPLDWHEESIGGKSVQVADPNADFPTPIALYATGDVLYFASSTDRAALEEILSQLP
jgi:hypothetical protein